MPKILLIDDEASIRKALKEILEYESYEVEEAEDGAAGLKKLEAGQFDIVFCDIQNGRNGIARPDQSERS